MSEGGYEVRLWKHDQLLYDRRFAFQAWIGGHGYMHDLANGFESTPRLIGKTLGFSLNEVSPLVDKQVATRIQARACIEVGPLWLKVVLAGYHSKHVGPKINCTCLLELEAEDVDIAPHSLVINFVCSPDEAVEFGRTLRAECVAAEAIREAQQQDPEIPAGHT